MVDTNVFLDVLLGRVEHIEDSQKVLNWCDKNPQSGWIAWHSLSNLYFIGERLVGKRASLKEIDQILEVFDLPVVGREAAKKARGYTMADFEDALQVACAESARVDYIVTRNIRDFKKSPISAVTPSNFILSL